MAFYFYDDLIDHRTGQEATYHYFNTSLDQQFDALVSPMLDTGFRNLDELVEDVLTAIGCPPDRRTRVAIVRAARRWRGPISELIATAPRLVEAFSEQASAAEAHPRPLDGTFWPGIWKAAQPVPLTAYPSSGEEPF
ncbi:hypothetical protein ACE2AJ_20165 [Aquihabitans daechungensis]|uniref:hypothetical protein n=1 Tax=Aquihabitans daechungensis TaxID=1052257 RepID=UPI003BA35054